MEIGTLEKVKVSKMEDMVCIWFCIFLFILVFLVFRTVYVICVILKNRNNLEDSNSRRKTPVKTMLIAGSGGHTSEILRLQSGLGPLYSPRLYVLADTDTMSKDKVIVAEKERQQKYKEDSFEIIKVPRSREVGQSWFSTVLSTLYACLHSLPIIIKCRPDLVLCNGPGTCIPLCAVAFLLRVLCIKHCKIVYVESVCRVQTLSLSAKILYFFADKLLVQWPSLQKKYPLSTYVGRVV